MENETALQEINPVAVTDIVSVERSVEQAEKYFNVLDRIRKAAIRLTNNLDWSSQGGKPYLEKSGCDKIASGFGVRVTETTYEKETNNDDKGEYVIYSCNVSGAWNNTTAQEIGTGSSRDDFFASAGKDSDGLKKYKPLSEIDLCDVKKKAFTNAMNRLIKRLIGLSYTWEEIAEASCNKITKDKVSTVDFNKGGKGGNVDSPETKKKRENIRQWILGIAMGEEEKAKAMLVGLTGFKGRDGNDVPGKNNVAALSEKQIEILFPKVEKLWKEFNANLDKQAAAESGVSNA